MPAPSRPCQVLIAGLGNMFLGDDAFGVEVVKRLCGMQMPEGVHVMDAGTRVVHLAYELREQAYDAVILIDAIAKGGDPGTLYLLEPDADDTTAPLASDGHAILAHDILTLVRQLGGARPRTVVVGCEPSRIGPDAGLSPAVAAALDGAVQLVMGLISSPAPYVPVAH